jgi:hypothetical protein
LARNRVWLAHLTGALLMLSVAAEPASAVGSEQGDPASGCPSEQVLVKIRDGADPAVVVARHGGTVLSTIPGIDVQVVAVAPGTLDATLADLQADPDVVYAEANGVMSVPERPAGAPCSPSAQPASSTPGDAATECRSGP